MVFNIRKLEAEDYDKILVGWWKDWRWTAPTRDFLPEDGCGGILVLDGETPVCAGFIYVTNSKVCWVDWIISNLQYKDKEKRHQAITLLIETITNIGKNSDAKYAYALIKNKNLIKTYEESGYIKGDSNAFEMIKKL